MIRIVLFLALAVFPAQVAAQPLSGKVLLANSPYPPYVMPENHPDGPGIDMEIAMTALAGLGVEASVKLVPFKRVLAMLEDGQADLTTSLSIRPEREEYLYWSLPYRTDTSYMFFTRRNSPFRPQRLEDLRTKKVGVVRGFVFPAAFADDPAIEKIEAPHIPSLMAMLLEGRFDTLIVNSIAGRHELMATGRMDEVTQAPFILRTPDDKGTVMGFSKARVSRDFVDRFNEEIRKMLDDGSIGRIEARYLD